MQPCASVTVCSRQFCGATGSWKQTANDLLRVAQHPFYGHLCLLTPSSWGYIIIIFSSDLEDDCSPLVLHLALCSIFRPLASVLSIAAHPPARRFFRASRAACSLPAALSGLALLLGRNCYAL